MLAKRLKLKFAGWPQFIVYSDRRSQQPFMNTQEVSVYLPPSFVERLRHPVIKIYIRFKLSGLGWLN